MNNRRDFLKHAGALALGGMLVSNGTVNAFYRKPKYATGLQLFTLFTIIDKDVRGNLAKVASIGYKEVESAFSMKGGYYGMKPKEFAALTREMGLGWKSHHVLGAPVKGLPAGMRTLKDNYQELVDEAAEGGIPYLVCAMSPTGTTAEVKETIDILNKTAEATHKAGIQFAYHNHYHEFELVDGKTPYDIMLAETDPQKMKFELDLCWVTKSGVDPVELFKKHPGRFPLWHVKDLDATKTKPEPVGTGIVDFKRIFAAANTAGMKHFFVEHDMPADPIASISTSFENLQKIIG
ncbi:secreted protein [Chitinophaga skermanii]|uniref:Secreted protein n=1 Tax=Chitinophaga skermanii TaxID=331697 RepID=A0A327Q1F0_9BACT|nr:sugar phosphate isomerase/epimerase [Chitinophaga skermanii]RAI97551.1 secreted protein [Chitinophaga skermanii]